MRIEAPESATATDYGVATESPGRKNIAGQPPTDPVFSCPQNPGPEIDVTLNRAIDALSRDHPGRSREEFLLGL